MRRDAQGDAMASPVATSEWVTTQLLPNADPGTARARIAHYSATPEAVADALGRGADLPFETQPPLLGYASAREDMRVPHTTQILLRKSRNDTWHLLINGQCARPNADGEYKLPLFRQEDLVCEDVSGRFVPAPCTVGVLVEHGALLPDSVRLQIRQRSFINGVRVNGGQEHVVTDVALAPTVPSDAASRATVVPYPMTLCPPASVLLHDNSKKRAEEEANRKKIARRIYDSVVEATQEDP